MARFDLEKLAEELAAKVRPDFEREIERARAEGYRAGIEAAAKLTEQYVAGSRYGERAGYLSLLDRIRALSQPREPTPSTSGGYPICNVENVVGHHCQLPTGHPTKHMDKHGNWWSEPTPSHASTSMVDSTSPGGEGDEKAGTPTARAINGAGRFSGAPTSGGSPAFPLCPEHAIRLPCPACAPKEEP